MKNPLQAAELSPRESPRRTGCATPQGPPDSSAVPGSDPAPIVAEENVALRAELFRLRQENAEALRRVAALEDAVAARDAFIGTAGHELRNAMAGVLVAATNLHFRAVRANDLPEWIVQRLELMGRQSRSFMRRATTLLDVSRLTSGGLRLSPGRVALMDVFDAVLAELGPEAEVAGCSITLNADRQLAGWWDREAVEQLALNLVSNAIKYGAGRPIEISAAVDGTAAALRVRDHGVGISDADRERIFARFERAVRPGNAPGFGMGLWIARQLAQAHGGEIEVESTPGNGSIFTARLPGVIHEPPR